MELIYILTYDCNFRCKYCDINKRNENISDNIIKKSITYLRNNNFDIDKVKFFWWEPLLKKQEIEFIVSNFPKKYNPNFYITSNSTLINDDFINFVKDNNIKLTFSIDWSNKTTSENRILENWLNLSNSIIENTKKYKDNIRINQVITSKNSKDFFKNFKFIYDLWVRNFNFLPEYYKRWSKSWLSNLKKWFDEIYEFYKSWNYFGLVNLDNYSDTSFFNLWIVIDTDWNLYLTNLILSWIFEKYKKNLTVWNVYDCNIQVNFSNVNFSKKYLKRIKEIIKKEYSEEVLKSVKYVDLILNNFCNNFSLCQQQNLSITK